ncbi:MAG TPA: ISNCY family transposase [Candidatus Acidoferrales bacterium]|nr:ISNCY family transposase [Candidatus Acidoferrales bacterium]
MKVQEVILRALSKQITFWQAAHIARLSPRQLRRWFQRYRLLGMDGLYDRRTGRPSVKRVPLALVEQVLCLYREKYFDFSVRHFHEKLREEHGITYSYTWVKLLLQGAGLVAKTRKRGPHRRKRERRPMTGMLLHADASRHRWLAGEPQHDLIVILDDATSEIYYAQLVEEESTATMMAALREVVEQRGLFCALYSDRGTHFWLTPKSGEVVDRQRLTQIGRALRDLGIPMIPAYSPQARGRSERNFGTWQRRLPQELRLRGITTVEEANRFLRESYIAELNRKFSVPAAQPGSAFLPAIGKDLQRIFSVQHERVVNQDNTVRIDNHTLQIEKTKWRSTLAKCRVLVCEHLDGSWSIFYGPHLVGRYAADGSPCDPEQQILEKGNPAPPAGFPFSTATPAAEPGDTRTGQIMC